MKRVLFVFEDHDRLQAAFQMDVRIGTYVNQTRLIWRNADVEFRYAVVTDMSGAHMHAAIEYVAIFYRYKAPARVQEYLNNRVRWPKKDAA